MNGGASQTSSNTFLTSTQAPAPKRQRRSRHQYVQVPIEEEYTEPEPLPITEETQYNENRNENSSDYKFPTIWDSDLNIPCALDMNSYSFTTDIHDSKKEWKKSNLYMYLRNHQRFITSEQVTQGMPYTHTMYNGGIFFIPEEESQLFHGVYARDMYEKNFVYVNEVPMSDVRKEVMDVDFVQATPITLEDILIVIRALVKVHKEVFPNEDHSKHYIYICRPEGDKVYDVYEPTGQQRMKYAFHIITDYVMTRDENAKIRYMVLAECKRYPRDRDRNSWEEVLDEAIYRSAGGLRMMGSRKKVNCKECAPKKKEVLVNKDPILAMALAPVSVPAHTGKRKQAGQIDPHCSHCGDTRKIDEGRPYWIWMACNGDGRINERLLSHMKREWVDCVYRCSMYLPQQARISLAPKIPNWVPNFDSRFRPTRLSTDNIRNIERTTNGNYEIIQPDSKLFTWVLDTIRTHAGDPYRTIELKKVVRTASGTVIKAFPKGNGQSWCYNKQGYHSQSNIWFELRRSTRVLIQRCFSSKTPEEGRCPCSRFYSNEFPISDSYATQIFFSEPDTTSRGSSKLSSQSSNKRRSTLALPSVKQTANVVPTPSTTETNASATEDRDLAQFIRQTSEETESTTHSTQAVVPSSAPISTSLTYRVNKQTNEMVRKMLAKFKVPSVRQAM